MVDPLPAGSRLLAEDLSPWSAAINAALTGRMIVKAADQTRNNTTTLVDDAHLQATLTANVVYGFLLVLLYNSGTTPDLKITWSGPAGLDMQWGGLRADTGGALTVPADLTESSTVTIGGIAAGAFAVFGGRVTATATGTWRLRWDQNTATVADTIVRQGSMLLLAQAS